MNLKNSYLCAEDHISDNAVSCPFCGSTAVWPISAWVRPVGEVGTRPEEDLSEDGAFPIEDIPITRPQVMGYPAPKQVTMDLEIDTADASKLMNNAVESLYWHGLPPFVEFRTEPWPWDGFRMRLDQGSGTDVTAIQYFRQNSENGWDEIVGPEDVKEEKDIEGNR